jgi:hypothetical protein
MERKDGHNNFFPFIIGDSGDPNCNFAGIETETI